MGNDALPVTTLSFQRIESGDGAIDPRYPNSLTSKGAKYIRVEPQFTAFKPVLALQDACAETPPTVTPSRADASRRLGRNTMF